MSTPHGKVKFVTCGSIDVTSPPGEVLAVVTNDLTEFIAMVGRIRGIGQSVEPLGPRAENVVTGPQYAEAIDTLSRFLPGVRDVMK